MIAVPLLTTRRYSNPTVGFRLDPRLRLWLGTRGETPGATARQDLVTFHVLVDETLDQLWAEGRLTLSLAEALIEVWGHHLVDPARGRVAQALVTATQTVLVVDPDLASRHGLAAGELLHNVGQFSDLEAIAVGLAAERAAQRIRDDEAPADRIIDSCFRRRSP